MSNTRKVSDISMGKDLASKMEEHYRTFIVSRQNDCADFRRKRTLPILLRLV